MAGKRYTLTSYLLTIKIPESLGFGETIITIGGPQSYTDSITISQDNALFEIEADTTGSYVYSKNLARNGKIEISLNQVSDAIAKFKKLMNIYYQAEREVEGLELILTDSATNSKTVICTCKDCLVSEIPTQEFGEKPGKQKWTLLSGYIDFAD